MEKKYSVGIGLNLFDSRAILLQEDGKPAAQIEKKRENISPNEVIEDLLSLFEGILEKAGANKDKITAVGIALGGIVNRKKGVVYWPQAQGSSYVSIALPLKDYFEKKFGLPVVVENDANACAWAEYCANFSKNKNMLYMFSGVGCGIIIDGQLYRGKEGEAGELFLKTERVMNSSLGDFSFLRQWPADLEMVKRAKTMISMGRRTSLIKKISPTGELSLRDIFEEAKKDKLAKEILQEAAFSLGVKMAFLINLLSPEVVVLGGGMEEAGEGFLDVCSDTVKNFSFSEMRRNLKIVRSELGKDAVALGAAMLACKEKSLQ